MKQNFQTALADVERLKVRVEELETELDGRPVVNETDVVELVHLRAEREAMAQRIIDLEQQAATAASAAANVATAVPWTSSCMTGLSSASSRRRSTSKHVGAEMSSRWIAPNPGEMRSTVSTISSSEPLSGVTSGAAGRSTPMSPSWTRTHALRTSVDGSRFARSHAASIWAVRAANPSAVLPYQSNQVFQTST